ncbi:MAG TPA: lipid-A-disaccharide synthase [Thermoanaerobaculia bacterium]|nr:lipid-A-disaccharide synthase [Thermoanaerobaculia bacterium]
MPGLAEPPLLVVAGEASGDLHGARLISELKRLDPGLSTFGLGGDQMQAAGLEAVAHSSEISVVGITEVLKILPRARQIFRALLTETERRQPRGAVLIDFPDFNLRLARELERRGVPVLYYISPQVWAWRRRRVKTIAKVVDRMLVLFPFEVDFYREAGVDVLHVGHPLVDEVPVLKNIWEREAATASTGGTAGTYRIALMPGSRRSEVEALLPTMLRSTVELGRKLPIAVEIIQAPTIRTELLAAKVAAAGLPAGAVRIVADDRFQAIADSHLVLCASGTATLEVGLLGAPMIVLYRLGGWTYLLARALVRLKNIALVNLVLGRRVVPELIQGEATPERIAAEAARLLNDRPALSRMRQALSELRGRLGQGGASERAARAVAGFLRLGVAA